MANYSRFNKTLKSFLRKTSIERSHSELIELTLKQDLEGNNNPDFLNIHLSN